MLPLVEKQSDFFFLENAHELGVRQVVLFADLADEVEQLGHHCLLL